MLPVSHSRESLTAQVFNSSISQVEQAILHDQPLTATTLSELTADLALVFAIGKSQALVLLGVSASRKTRNATLSADILDRALMAVDCFARVARILGPAAAQAWFATPKRALDGARPLDLLPTRLGLSRLHEMLTALEDGAYL
jgi:uncharacterized protein (DUF2384 family)